MLNSFSTLALVASISAVQAAVASSVVLRDSPTHWGPGCPQGSSFWAKQDGDCIQTHFPAFDLTSGGAQSDKTANCGVSITIGGQDGRQFSVASSTYRDDINIPDGTSAVHLMSYYFPTNAASTADTRHSFEGPFDAEVEVTAKVPAGSRVWSPCGSTAQLIINNRGAVTGDPSSRHSRFNTATVLTYLEWRGC